MNRLFVVVLLILGLAAVGWAQTTTAAPVAITFTDVLIPDEEVQGKVPTSRLRYVSVDAAVLTAAAEAQVPLAFELFEGVTVTAVPSLLMDLDGGEAGRSWVWHGRAPDRPFSDITFSLHEGALMATLHLTDVLYRIRPVGNGVHRLEQLPLGYLGGLPPIAPPEAAVLADEFAADEGLDVLVDDGSVVEVLVLYTTAVRNALGGTAEAQALVNLAVAETNMGYANSGVRFRLNLAHTVETSYVENGDFSSELTHLYEMGDGFLDDVHALRDAHYADVVVLLIDGQAYCGLAYTMQTPSQTFARAAFSVVDYTCATGYYSFGHEIGHNMGSQHDRDNAGSGMFAYSHGYRHPGALFRTVMAYNCPTGCPRVNYWSNPSVFYSGQPTGLMSLADNVRSLNRVATVVANFRARPAPPPVLDEVLYLPVVVRP